MDPTQLAVIGMDSGNTKTAAVCMTCDGRLVAALRVRASNYQSIGEGPAQARMLEALMPLADAASTRGLTIAGFGFGLTGLDRPRDEAVLDRVTRRLMAAVADRAPCTTAPARVLVNDACLVLRAGTDDGVGVAVSSGTGGNCVGRGRDGTRVQIGGLCHELGDGGGASDLAIAGLRAAGRARDGRGPATIVGDLVVAALGLSDLTDLMDLTIPGAGAVAPDDADPPSVAQLAPLVFEAARQGDAVALAILDDIGRDLGLSARVAAQRLFATDSAFPLVLGGSVLAGNPDSPFANAIVAEVHAHFPAAVPRPLDVPPVAGAALLALDALADGPETASLTADLRDGTLRRTVLAAVKGDRHL